MTYVVTENCIKCKYMDCVEVCPVDCFYEGENMLVIHPDECIDCGVCEPECPAEAIKPDAEPGLEQWLKLNADMAKSWPNITIKKDAPADAKEFDGVAGKFESLLLVQSRRGRLRLRRGDQGPGFGETGLPLRCALKYFCFFGRTVIGSANAVACAQAVHRPRRPAVHIMKQRFASFDLRERRCLGQGHERV